MYDDVRVSESKPLPPILHQMWVNLKRGPFRPRYVSRRSGQAAILLCALAIIFPLILVFLPGMLGTGSVLTLLRSPYHQVRELTIGLVVRIGIITTLSAAGAGHLMWLNRRIKACWNIDEAAQRLSLSGAETEQRIADSRIEPKYIVDGVPVYEPSRLTEASLLLRSSAPPDVTLLRAASKSAGYLCKLLRATNDDIVSPIVAIDHDLVSENSGSRQNQ